MLKRTPVVPVLLAIALARAMLPASASAQPAPYSIQWGTPGTVNGQFDDIGGQAVDGGGNVYVVDRNNHRIQKFGYPGAAVIPR